MDLPELTVDLNLDTIDFGLNWLQHNLPNSQIEKELEELFEYFDNSNKEIDSCLSNTPSVKLCSNVLAVLDPELRTV